MVNIQTSNIVRFENGSCLVIILTLTKIQKNNNYRTQSILEQNHGTCLYMYRHYSNRKLAYNYISQIVYNFKYFKLNVTK